MIARAVRLALGAATLSFGCSQPDDSGFDWDAMQSSAADGPSGDRGSDALRPGTDDAEGSLPDAGPSPLDARSTDALPDSLAAVTDAETDDGAAALLAERRAILLALRRLPGPPPDPTNASADDPRALRLGHRLFFETRLSRTGATSCATCHAPDRAFSGLLSYDGHGGLAFRNPPSLLGVAARPWLFWNGRADTLWGQVVGPLEDPHELGLDRVSLARLIHRDGLLRAEYEAAFAPLQDRSFFDALPPRAKPSTLPEERGLNAAWGALTDDQRLGVNTVLANVGKALAAYERRLEAPVSAFDTFVEALLAGDERPDLSESAQRGLWLFHGRLRCAGCHSGPEFSDFRFHRLGLRPQAGDAGGRDRAAAGAHLQDAEFGAGGPFSDAPDGAAAQRTAAFLAAGARPEDVGAFRTPSLRNVAETPPYLHDGRFETLEDVVRYKTALPHDLATEPRDVLLDRQPLSEAELSDVVAFLHTLSSAPVEAWLRSPP